MPDRKTNALKVLLHLVGLMIFINACSFPNQGTPPTDEVIEPTTSQTPVDPTPNPTATLEPIEKGELGKLSAPIIGVDNFGEIIQLMSIADGPSNSSDIAFSPDGNWLASSLQDNTVNIWDVNDGSLIINFQAHAARVSCLDFSPDGNFLVTGSWDKNLKLWQVSDWSEVRTLTGHTSFVGDCEFSPNSELLVSGGDDNRVLVWNVPEGSIYHELAQLSISILHVKFSPDGSLIAATSGQSMLRIWNTEDGSLYRAIEADANLYSLAFSPDGIVIAGGPAIVEAFVGTPLARITFWDLTSGAKLGTISEATTAIEMSFSPDNSLVFSVRTNPPNVVIWRATDGVLIHELTGHTDLLWGFALNDDGSMIATKSRDGQIILWGLPQE